MNFFSKENKETKKEKTHPGIPFFMERYPSFKQWPIVERISLISQIAIFLLIVLVVVVRMMASNTVLAATIGDSKIELSDELQSKSEITTSVTTYETSTTTQVSTTSHVQALSSTTSTSISTETQLFTSTTKVSTEVTTVAQTKLTTSISTTSSTSVTTQATAVTQSKAYDFKQILTESYELDKLSLEASVGSVYTISRADYIHICNLVAMEYGAVWVSPEEQAKVAETVINRLISSKFSGDNVNAIITAPYQYRTDLSRSTYHSKVTDSVRVAVLGFLNGIFPNHGYTGYYGDGKWNHFK